MIINSLTFYFYFISFLFINNWTYSSAFFSSAMILIKFTYSLLILLIFIGLTSQCVHDHFAHKSQKHFFNDLDEGRRLQETESGRYLLK